MIRNYSELLSKLTYSQKIKSLVTNLLMIYSKNKSRYLKVSQIVSIPSEIIFTIHYLESNCNFNTHLHNGDPLTGRTIHVPKGRPKEGDPPFTWEQSAVDAIKDHYAFKKVKDWKNPNEILEALERWNGLGYLKRGVQSPYIFGNSNLHVSGKFTFDGRFDPNAKTKQIGAAIILKEMNYF